VRIRIYPYEKVLELSAKTDAQVKEELIQDTQLRFRAMLDYTLDVFTADRMESKSYQLPFAMFFVAKSMFKESVAAIASEACMTVANWDYRVRSNLLRFILFDDNAEKCFIEKMTIFFMALEECKGLEDNYMSDCKRMSLAEFYPGLLKEVENLDYEKVHSILLRIRNGKKRYCLAYNHAIWKVNESRIPANLKEMYEKCEKSKSRYSHEGMEEDLVDFIQSDMCDYLMKNEASAYNPFWIFGTGKYKENIDFIYSRKYVVEFDTIWIHYLSLKAAEEEKRIEYISSFCSNPVKGKVVQLHPNRVNL